MAVFPPSGSELRGAVLAALIRSVAPVLAYKTANQTVNNSTVLVNDNHLLWSVDPNAAYALRLTLYMNSGGTPDFRLQFIGPAGTTMSWATIFVGPGGTTQLAGPFAIAAPVTFDGQGAATPIYIDGTVQVGSSGGTLRVQWAQATADNSDTTVLNGSFGILTLLA